MLTYYFSFFTIFLSNLINLKLAKDSKFFIYSLFGFFLIFFIGFRHEIGGDWTAYLNHFENFDTSSIFSIFKSWDIGYAFFEYISSVFGFGIYGVNTLCAIFFTLSFLYFIKIFNLKLSRALLIAFPYLIMVVAMGYSRQGVAIGFIMVFFALLYQRKLLKSLVFLLLATLFHKTAIVSIIVLFLNRRFINFKTIGISIPFFVLGLYILLPRLEGFYINYFLQQMQSSGAVIRILINITASIVLIIFAKRYKNIFGENDFEFWKPFIYISIVMFLFAILLNITTIADRILLYFYPLQIVVFSRMLYLIKDKNLKNICFLGYILFSFLILFIFLNFGTYSEHWIPYNNLLLMENLK